MAKRATASAAFRFDSYGKGRSRSQQCLWGPDDQARAAIRDVTGSCRISNPNPSPNPHKSPGFFSLFFFLACFSFSSSSSSSSLPSPLSTSHATFALISYHSHTRTRPLQAIISPSPSIIHPRRNNPTPWRHPHGAICHR